MAGSAFSHSRVVSNLGLLISQYLLDEQVAGVHGRALAQFHLAELN